MVTVLLVLAVSFNTSASNNGAAAATNFSQNMRVGIFILLIFLDFFADGSLSTPNKILI